MECAQDHRANYARIQIGKSDYRASTLITEAAIPLHPGFSQENDSANLRANRALRAMSNKAKSLDESFRYKKIAIMGSLLQPNKPDRRACSTLSNSWKDRGSVLCLTKSVTGVGAFRYSLQNPVRVA